MNLKQAIFEIFPNALNEEGEIKEKFKGVDVKINTIPLAGNSLLKDLYAIFANPDGYLYLTINV